MSDSAAASLDAVFRVLGALARRAETVADRDRRAPAVSSWGARQQLLHAALVAGSVATAVKGLLRGRGEEGPVLTEEARAILAGGVIPRGVAQAPGPLRPEPSPAAASVAVAVEKTRRRWEALAEDAAAIDAAPRRMPHPVLGAMTAAEWTRFVSVHTAHHLAIVEEILAADQ